MSLRVAVVGAGIMGANHARVARTSQRVELVAVVDEDLDRATRATAGRARAHRALQECIDDVDAVVIAVPTGLHHELALEAVAAGKHVLVEKPIASTVAEAEEITSAAAAAGVVLAVGHIERFNPAIVELPKWVTSPVHIRAERINPYSPRILDGVVVDLMIHDLDILLSLAGDADVVHAEGVAQHHRSPSEDMAVATIAFDSGLTASLTTSRLGQQKIRQIEVTQDDSVVVADLLRQDVVINRMTRSEYLSEEGTRYQQASVVEIPFLETRGEPLALELDHFVDCVEQGTTPRVDGRAGMRALELALRVSHAIHHNERGGSA